MNRVAGGGVLCVLLLAGGHAAGAPLSARVPSAVSPAPRVAPVAPVSPALLAPGRPAPPARLQAPNKPENLGGAGGGPLRDSVHWTVPDQSGGREIQQWLVRACPAVQGSPYAACQPVAGPAAGQASGATVQAQIPSHITYMGADAPVIAAEICARNSAGQSCADRLALKFAGIGIAPAPHLAIAQGGAAAGTVGIRAAPHSGIAVKKTTAPVHASAGGGTASAALAGVHALAATPAGWLPATLNFGSLWSGDRRRLSVTVQLRDDTPAGEFAASLTATPGSVFKILQLQIYGTPSKAAQRAIAPLSLGSARPPTAARSQPPGNLAAPGAQFAAGGTLLASRSSPPFTLAAKGGDRIVITVESAPVLNLFNGPTAGNYDAKLQLGAKSWSAAIPVTEMFNGLKTGVVATLESYDVVAYMPESYYPGTTTGAQAVMTLVNTDNFAHTVTVSATQLPPGFSFAPQQAVIGAGRTAKLTLPFTATWGSKPGQKAPMANLGQQQATLQVAYEGAKKSLAFSLDAIESRTDFHWSGTNCAKWSLDLTIHTSGDFHASYIVTNDNLIPKKFWFEIGWNNKQVTFSQPAGDVGAIAQKQMSWGWNLGGVRDGYLSMRQLPPTVVFHCSDNL